MTFGGLVLAVTVIVASKLYDLINKEKVEEFENLLVNSQ